ncbi:MAG: heavy-metal-associated domain-containing protein [Kofleriaceae bacterium]|nr:heavy-metal-associated domain-containing protein [Kofleriaceae bacterium]
MNRYLQVVHAIPGRTRLRCPAIREDHASADRVAEALSQMHGVREVKVRPYTGSILVTHDSAVTVDELVATAMRVLDCQLLVRLGEEPPVPSEVPELAQIARQLAQAVGSLDRDLLRFTEGDMDLGTLVTLGFFGLGAAQTVVDREIELPPWFQLAWWGYRTFMTAEQDEIEGASSAGVVGYDDD